MLLPLLCQPRLVIGFRSGRLSVRPMHLFGRNCDDDYYYVELPDEGERDTQSIARCSKVKEELNMSLQRFLTAHTFVLFVCIPVWIQAFGTSVTGNAATSPCGTNQHIMRRAFVIVREGLVASAGMQSQTP